MRLMILVFLAVIGVDVLACVYIVQLTGFWQLAAALAAGTANGAAIWWLCLGGRWHHRREPHSPMTFERFVTILRKEGLPEDQIQSLWDTRPYVFFDNDEHLILLAVRKVIDDLRCQHRGER